LRRKIFQRIFALGIFWSECYAANPLIVVLSPGHSDITMFRSRSPTAVATGTYMDRAEKIPKFSQTTGTVDVF
jgi:hypothetical protein